MLICDLILNLRNLGLHRAGFIIAKKAQQNLDLTDEEEQHVLLELTITSFYIGEMEEGMKACESLIVRKKSISRIRETAVSNQRYYLQKHQTSQVVDLDFETPLIENSGLRWSLFNPSIIQHKGGYYAIARTSNYAIREGIYHTINADGIVRTRNYLLRLDSDFKILSKREVVDNLKRRRYPVIIWGMEDCRLFIKEEKLYFTCTTIDNHSLGYPQISLALIDSLDNLDKESKVSKSETVEIKSLKHLPGPTETPTYQKNWLPFTVNGKIKYLYHLNPITVLDENLAIEDFNVPPINTDKFRGSAGPINYNDGYLVMYHHVIFVTRGERYYIHRYVFLDTNFKIVRYSHPFMFFKLGIEYVCGMCLNEQEDKVVITLGVNDQTAKIVTADRNIIDDMLSIEARYDL